MQPHGLGVGIIWWPALDALCRESEGLVDVIEAEPETFWAPASDGLSFRSSLGESLRHLHQPKLLHGVGAPLGGTCPPPEGHLVALARDVAELRPEYVSEHLSLTRFRPAPGARPLAAGFMLPPLQSQSGVLLAAANIRRRRAVLGNIPLAVETPVSYLPPAAGEWPDGSFVGAVAEAADCGILLDLHNIWCNARNGRQTVAAFCHALPLDRVWELHLAGGQSEDGYHLDAHAGLVEQELMEITADLVPRLPNLRAIVFETMPEWVAKVGLDAIGRQLGRLKDIWNTRRTAGENPAAAVRLWPPSDPPYTDPEAWETLLGCAINRMPQPEIGKGAKAWWRSAQPAIALYRKLVAEGRANAALFAAPLTIKLLLRHSGGPATRRILAEFSSKFPPGYTAADEARALFEFLSASQPAVLGLREAIASDAAALDGASAPEPVIEPATARI